MLIEYIISLCLGIKLKKYLIWNNDCIENNEFGVVFSNYLDLFLGVNFFYFNLREVHKYLVHIPITSK